MLRNQAGFIERHGDALLNSHPDFPESETYAGPGGTIPLCAKHR